VTNPEDEPRFTSDETTRRKLLDDVFPRLLTLLDDLPPEPQSGVNYNGYAVAHGFYCRVVRTCQAALLLTEADLGSEAGPLRRAALEHALALAWVIDEPDAAPASLLRAHQARLASIKKLISGTWDTISDDDVAKLLDLDIATHGQDHLVYYGHLAKLYADENGLMIAWLTETGESHPSHTTASTYWRDNPRSLATTASNNTASDVHQVGFIWWLASCQMDRLAGWGERLAAIGRPAGLGVIELRKKT
jgi:hypothetical protein